MRRVLLFALTRRPPTSTLFPYTTLFRSLATGTQRPVPIDHRMSDFAAGQRGAPQHSAIHKNTGSDSASDLDINRKRNRRDRKSTRLNSSHRTISYAVFCLKKKKPVLQRS